MTDGPIQDAIARIQTLPTLPSILSQILATVGDPDASAVELSRHIAADQSLSAGLLKVVNSASYGHYRRVDTITQAVVILGFYEVRNLALAAVAFRSFPRGHSDYDRVQLWRHSLATAIATERCAKMFRVPSENAFMAGLLHDIGKVVLDALYPDRFRECARRARLEQRPVRELEHEIFGMDHADVGALLGQRWLLPPTLVAVLQSHHDPNPAMPGARLVALTGLGDFIAYQAGFGESSNGCPPAAPPEVPGIPVTEENWSIVAGDLRLHSERINELLGAFA